MKHLKPALCVLYTLCCLLSCLCGCSGESIPEEGQSQPYAAEDDFGKTLKETEDFTEVARNDHLVMYVKGTTAEVMIQDIQTGNCWYSNPQDRGTDTSAQTKQLGSQLDIWVYDENRILNTLRM